MPMTRKEALQQAQAEGLTLRKSKALSGYAHVLLQAQGHAESGLEPYQAWVRRSGESVHLGNFSTAEEAALCVARLAAQEAAALGAAAPDREAAVEGAPLTSEEALQQAQAEGLVLRVGRSGTGYLGVHLTKPDYPKPYQARVRRGGKEVHLGSFATAEEAALCIARSLEWMARRSKVGAALAAAKRAEAWAQRVQNDEADGWSMESGVGCAVQ